MTRPASLLIDEEPLQVLPTLAERVGLNEAIVLQQVHFWLRKSKNEFDGRKWTYDTYEEWQQKNFPFWSVKTVQRAFLSLEAQGLLISMQPEKRDRRKWYTIDYDRLEELASDTHTRPSNPSESDSPPRGQVDPLQEDKLSLSDVPICPVATGQSDLLGEANLSPPSGQPGTLYIEVSENSSEISGELTHTGAARAPASGDAAKVCVCPTPHRSKLCDEERIRIAANIPTIRNAESYAMSAEVRRGRDDALLAKRRKEIEKPGAKPERDTGACPDCHGQGFWYPEGDTPEGRAKGIAKCLHSRLEAMAAEVAG